MGRCLGRGQRRDPAAGCPGAAGRGPGFRCFAPGATWPDLPDCRPGAGSPAAESPHRLLLRRYCTSCHSDRLKTAGLSLDTLDLSKVSDATETWEKVVWKLRGGIMPPVGRPRPDAAEHRQFASWLETELDRAAAAQPNPGRVPHAPAESRRVHERDPRPARRSRSTGRRCCRPTKSATASTTSRATWRSRRRCSSATCRRRAASAGWRSAIRRSGPAIRRRSTSCRSTSMQNDRMSEDLPFGSRAGVAVRHHFPLDGEYHHPDQAEEERLRVHRQPRRGARSRCAARRRARRALHGRRRAGQGKPAPVSFSGTFMAAGGAGYPDAGVGRLPDVRRRAA